MRRLITATVLASGLLASGLAVTGASAGVAGPVGPAGASVGETFTVFSQDFPPNNAVYVGGQVWCPAGSQLTGGGYVIDNFTSHPIQATGSYPVGNSWTAFLTNVPSYTYSEDSGITVYAICAS